MKNLTELCDKHFNCSSLYDVLGVDRDVDEAAGMPSHIIKKLLMSMSNYQFPYSTHPVDTLSEKSLLQEIS